MLNLHDSSANSSNTNSTRHPSLISDENDINSSSHHHHHHHNSNSNSTSNSNSNHHHNNQNHVYINSNIAFTSSDLTRIIIQSLHTLGYRESATKLEMESGLQTQSCNVRQLFSSIYEGNWDLCFQLVKIVEFTADSCYITGLITELLYIELILSKDTKSALQLLRTELRKYVQDPTRIKVLSSCILCSGELQLLKICKGNSVITTRTALVNQLKEYISPDQLIGESCLEDLVIDALKFRNLSQIPPPLPTSTTPSPNNFKRSLASKFPFKRLKQFSTDHQATSSPRSPPGADDQPLILHSLLGENKTSKTVQSEQMKNKLPNREIAVLKGHKNEVWLVSFSPCGKFLATAGIDNIINIWCVYSTTSSSNEVHPSHFLSLVGGPLDPTTQTSRPLALSWNEFSNKLLCCYDNDDGVYYWNLTSMMANPVEAINSSILFSNRYSHHHNTAADSVEMCTVTWLAIPPEEKQLYSNGVEMREYFVSLSQPFHMFICDLEGDIFASYSGFDGNIATQAISLPRVKSQDKYPSPQYKSKKNILYVHSNVDVSKKGWKSMSDVSLSPKNENDEDNETWKESQGEFSYPCGSRVVVVKSETCLQLFHITTNVSPQSNSTSFQESGPKSSPPYRFELITELNISVPIVTISVVPLLNSMLNDCARDSVLVLSCFGGSLKTIILENDDTIKVGTNYLGYKFNRMISQPSGYRFYSDCQEIIHIACGNENSTVSLWNEPDTPKRALTGHSGTINSSHFSPLQCGLLATASDDHTVRLWFVKNSSTSGNHENGNRNDSKDDKDDNDDDEDIDDDYYNDEDKCEDEEDENESMVVYIKSEEIATEKLRRFQETMLYGEEGMM